MSLRWCKLGCEGVRVRTKRCELGCEVVYQTSLSGAFGKVFRGEMKKPDSKFENIAIKTIKSKFFSFPWDIAT